jgi:hypothetical protein
MMRTLCILAALGSLALLPRAARADDLQGGDAARHAVIQNALYGPTDAKVTIEPVRWHGYGWGGPGYWAPRYYGGWYGTYRPYYGGYYYSVPYYSAYPTYSTYPYTYYYNPGIQVARPWIGFGVYR